LLASRVKRLSKDSLIYGLGGALARGVGIILLPIYLKILVPGEYAIYSNILNASSLFFVLVTFGLDGAATILYFETDDQERRRELTSAWLYFNLLVSIPFALLLFFLTNPLASLMSAQPPADTRLWLTISVLTLPFSLLASTFAAILRLNFRPIPYVVVSWIATFLNLVVALVLVLFFHLGVVGALCGPLVGSIFGTVGGFWLTRHNYQLHLSYPLLSRMLRLSWPLVPAGAAVWVNNSYAAGFFLARLGGSEADQQVAIFNAVLKISVIVSLMMTAFQLAWVPYSLSIANEPDAKRTYAKLLTYYIVGFGGLAFALGLFGREILTAIDFDAGARQLARQQAYIGRAVLPVTDFDREGYAVGYKILGLLTFAAIIAGAYFITAVGSNISKKTSNISWTTIIAALVSIGLNITLIPSLGITGAALASLAASVLMISLAGILSQRHYPIPFEVNKVVITLVFGLGLLLLGEGIQLNSWWLNLLAKAAFLLLYPTAILLSGVISQRELSVAVGAVRRRLGR